jgi:ribosomal protein S18 acetylase RimI-like enzyme
MVEIRSITLEDIPAFRETLDAVARERRYLHMLEAPPLERLTNYVRTGLEKGHIHLVAADGSKIAGWCDITPGLHGEVHVGHLGMGVHRDFRGQGIGRRLMEAALAQARALRLEKIELQVFTANKPALALYKKLGFIEEGLRQRARCVDGVYDDILLLALFLG